MISILLPLQLTLLVGAGALSSPVLPQKTPLHPITDASTKQSCGARPSFRSILRKAGKTLFRPGGSESTAKLHSWSSLGPENTVIDVAADMGTGGVAFAKQTGCRVTLVDLDVEQQLERSTIQVTNKHDVDLSLVDTLKMNINNIDQELENRHFDCAIVEATLTHYPTIKKQLVLKGLAKHADEILIHELSLRGPNIESGGDDCVEARQVKHDMGRALAIGFHPLTVAKWKELLNEVGYEVVQVETGPIAALNPVTMLKDEGLRGFAKIVWNIASDSEIRNRIIETRNTLKSHEEELGYVLIKASLKKA